MRISTSAFGSNFISRIQQLQTQQNQLQNEASTGLKVSLPEDNPGAMTQVLNLQTTQDQNSQYQTNIAQLQTTASTAGTAMSSLQTIISRASEIATTASSGTTSTSAMATYATELNSLINQAVQIGNTTDADGNYIFSGTAITTKPFTATTDANGNVTGVTYNGNTSTSQAEIGKGITASVEVPGENTSGSGATGLFSDSAAGTNVFADLISLQQNLAAGNSSAIASTNVAALNTDEDNVTNSISANGVTQSALTAANNVASSQTTNIASAISNDTDADLAQTLTELSQTQTAYQAALESGTMVMQMSILNYLS